MRYLITDDANNTLATLDVPKTEGTTTVVIERADDPDLTLCGIDLHGDGTVVVGHWPEGEDWHRVFTTTGVPNAYSGGTPPRTLDPLYRLSTVKRAMETAFDRAYGFGGLDALDVFREATLALLANPRSEYPNPDSDADSDECNPDKDTPDEHGPAPAPAAAPVPTVTVRKSGTRYTSEFSALPGRTFGPWDFPEMVQDLTISALLEPRAARDLVMDAAVANDGAATAPINR
ncbi:hypothetical protein [Streptomyces sp. NPDC088915]|uniref:hypothetical protein n=1 Tax=Streptomyces sp. NPDC088915 TaxID=3365912 RepID=UPI003801D06D